MSRINNSSHHKNLVNTIFSYSHSKESNEQKTIYCGLKVSYFYPFLPSTVTSHYSQNNMKIFICLSIFHQQANCCFLLSLISTPFTFQFLLFLAGLALTASLLRFCAGPLGVAAAFGPLRFSRFSFSSNS